RAARPDARRLGGPADRHGPAGAGCPPDPSSSVLLVARARRPDRRGGPAPGVRLRLGRPAEAGGRRAVLGRRAGARPAEPPPRRRADRIRVTHAPPSPGRARRRRGRGRAPAPEHPPIMNLSPTQQTILWIYAAIVAAWPV